MMFWIEIGITFSSTFTYLGLRSDPVNEKVKKELEMFSFWVSLQHQHKWELGKENVIKFFSVGFSLEKINSSEFQAFELI